MMGIVRRLSQACVEKGLGVHQVQPVSPIVEVFETHLE